MLSVDGVMAREARFVVQRFADRLSTKWGKSYGEVLGWVRSRLSFAISRATNRCVRGSRVKWRSGVGMEDRAGLALMIHYTSGPYCLLFLLVIFIFFCCLFLSVLLLFFCLLLLFHLLLYLLYVCALQFGYCFALYHGLVL